MYNLCQIFILIVAVIYSSYTVLADESERCDCNVLQIYDRFGVIGIQNFTKQNNIHNGNPIYFSTLRNMITSNDNKWTYYQYNAAEKMFDRIRTYSKQNFDSFEKFKNKCKNKINNTTRYISAISLCLRDSSNCSGIREEYWSTQDIHLLAKNACKFPFIHKNVTYNACTNQTRKKPWCATTVDATYHVKSWGFCIGSCPVDNMSTTNEETDKSRHINTVGYGRKIIKS